MAGENQSNRGIIIPENVLDSKRYFGFRKRNVIEGLILAGIVAMIILKIPFVKRIKIIFICILCPLVFLLSCIGVKDKSPFELFSDIKSYLQTPKKYHLRSIDHATKRKKALTTNNTVYTQQSAAEKTFQFIKETIDKFRTPEGR